MLLQQWIQSSEKDMGVWANTLPGTERRVIGRWLPHSFRGPFLLYKDTIMSSFHFAGIFPDFIMNHVSRKVGIQVGLHTFTDIDYADDVTLFVDTQDKYPIALSAMDEEAAKFGLHVS